MGNKLRVLLFFSISINILIIAYLLAAVYKNEDIDYVFNKFKNSAKVETSNAVNIQRSSLFKLLPIDKNDIVFIGDSITQRCEWSELFNDYHIKNRGIDFNTTTDVINRLDEITNQKPKKIFIMIGINDLNKEIDKNIILNNYNQILARIKKKSPNTKVYVQSVLPINDQISNNLKVKNIQVIKFNSELKKLTNLYNDTFIDLYELYADNQGLLNNKFTIDGVHLTGDGYIVWRIAIKKHIKE